MNYVVNENNNNTFNNVSKLRHYNSLKEEDDEDENNLDPKRVGYEVRHSSLLYLPTCNFKWSNKHAGSLYYLYS